MFYSGVLKIESFGLYYGFPVFDFFKDFYKSVTGSG